ncbi:MAG: helix-turn-helix transcriptional regulator [Ruminococcus sp.]|nr:helix-turn-helix transcriptional regulator [Ruminococcus sp.]
MKEKSAHDSLQAVEGILLKMERIRQDKGQKEVCYGICVPSYLSKIEHGTVSPEREILAKLFDRLGIYYEEKEEKLSEFKKLIDEYFYCLHYALDTKPVYGKLKAAKQVLTYSRYAVDWLLIEGFEEKTSDPLLEKLEPHMGRVRRAYYQILIFRQRKERDADKLVRICEEACEVLHNSFAMSMLCEAYFEQGDYTAIHAMEQRFVAAAVEEGNTARLAYCFFLNGSAYACLNMEDMMMVYYERCIRLLQNTGWKAFRQSLYYNIGATLTALKKYDEALEYLHKAQTQNEEDNPDDAEMRREILHKKTLACFRMGNREEGEKFLEKYKEAVFSIKEASALERLRYQEAAMEAKENFLDKPEYLEVLEKLIKAIGKDKHFGYLYFYKEQIIEAYKRQRQYKKALEFAEKISGKVIKHII